MLPSTIWTVLLVGLTSVATACGVAYIYVRVRALNAYRAFTAAHGDAEQSTGDAYKVLDRRQKRLAVVILGIYALTAMVLGPLLQPASGVAIACLVLVTLATIAVAVTASICNDRESMARVDWDSKRRYLRLAAVEGAGLSARAVQPARGDNALGQVKTGVSGCGCLVDVEPQSHESQSIAAADALLVPQPLILVGDFGKDMDDEDTLVLSDGVNRHQVVSTQGSRKQELFEMLAVVANLAPALERARLAKGTLRLLGHPAVPVGVGTDCGLRPDGHEKEFEGVTYLAAPQDVEPGADLLVRSLQSCDDGSAILLLISGLTDVAALLREHAALVKDKTAVVAIMGGVEQKDDQVVLDADGYMIPDSAANNKFDMDAAKFVYRRLQELGVPMTILTREAAYAAPVPRDLYDRMAATGHPVGVKLQRTQRHAIQDVWVRANMAGDDERRNKLPERCNREWFCNTFCAGEGKERTGEDDIWDLIKSFQLYDPMTLVAAVPELAERFFDPAVVVVNGVEHKVIGVSKARTGVKDPAGLSAYMIECFIASLLANSPQS